MQFHEKKRIYFISGFFLPGLFLIFVARCVSKDTQRQASKFFGKSLVTLSDFYYF